MMLVTGGAGFIGSHIVAQLVARGDQVKVIDDLSSGRIENLSEVSSRIEFIQGDIQDEDLLRQALRGVKCVFHLAAMASVPASVAEPILCHSINVTATLKLLQAAREQNVKRVVMSSSAAVYGENPLSPKREDFPLEPQSPYAASKAMLELYAQTYFRVYGLETVCLRYFNVFGPRQNPHSQYASVVPAFFDAVAHGRNPIIYGDGEQTRDFVHVSDVAKANLLAAERDGVGGEVFNVATGASYSINQLFETINRLTGGGCSPDYRPSRAGDIRHSSTDIAKARRLLGFEPEVSLEAGLQDMAENMKKPN